ncbi:MAG: glycosyltransferase family 4 protein [Deltaproteobacteria bacterium]|nr:glycosyltransferase family 4 protein [Deltaproteobacteria bacterium]
MKFGSVDMFMDLSNWGYRMGRPVANEGFLKALLTYGSYDEYEFFCPDSFHMDYFLKRISRIIDDPQNIKRVKPSLQIALSESIRTEKYQIFHMGDFTYFMPYLIGMRNRLAENPFPITGITHSLDALYMNLRYLELVYACPASFDGIICTSQAAKQSVEKGLNRLFKRVNEVTRKTLDLPVRFKKIPLGIDDDLFNQTDKADARRYFHIPDHAVVALSVGRLSLRQKCDWSPVFELLSRMYKNENIENLLLLFAGGADESDVSLLEALISRYCLEEKVLLLPNFSADIKTRLYKAADFYISVVDNFQETFGLNIIEAMASGLPVIASDFSGYRESVVNNKNGFLISTRWLSELPEFLNENLAVLDPSLTKLYLSQTVALDLDQLHRAIKTLYQEDMLRKSMGFQSIIMAKQYRWENIIHSYEDFWASLAEEASSSKYGALKTNLDILEGEILNTFSHYPSYILSENDEFSITRVGQDVLDNKIALTKYQDVSVCFFDELEHLILNLLLTGNLSLESIKDYAAEKLEATRGQTLFHLGWLLKHGAIRVSKAHGVKI